MEKPEGTIFLIPLRLDDCDTPRSLRQFHKADYFGDNKEKSYANLVVALKERLVNMEAQKIIAELTAHIKSR